SIRDKLFNKKCLSMKFLSYLDNTDKETKLRMIASLIESYSAWISKLEKQAMELEPDFQETADRHINECKETLKRMKDGLDLLRENSIVYNAFALANRAMFMQRIHSETQSKDKYPGDETLQNEMVSLNYYNIGEKYFWRPFQLAFIIMSIKSIVDPESNDRDLVDLIWFPTGGGKTEAYLGLTAFTIFFRRLSFPKTASGTAVIMRYTLRLLAAQQFVRASTLICACEVIRKDCEMTKKYPVYPLGKDRITIGLWIGGQHTPNRNSEAKANWNKLVQATVTDLRDIKDKHNKFQILKCPWCGTKLIKDVSPDKRLIGQWGYLFRNGHFYMACPQEGCQFEDSLPIQVVDEELYEDPPTLLFGTVDKFAMLPWKQEAGSFFAVNSKNRAPELIIQDELHLISGPLGTIAGLYEVAIDSLCSRKGIKPKIVASTATIRRAKEQCAALYNRMVRQFPPAGLDAEDSFFAREADLNEKPGRMYMGIMPSGKTKAMMEARVIAAILQRVYMMDLPYNIKDKFWTLVVYFNSLRDLGKCSTIVDDDVKDFIRRIAFRFGTKKGIRQIGAANELTSRVTTSHLNETLEKLERLEYSKENQENKRYPINVLLATNMISVGVDVARLNIMLIVGQPKLTSEYIQASSRIGRSFPGIALTLYDGAKSRDRSHYEQFKAYHESFYKYVEPTVVTPFAKPARDRALHAVIVS
ncbi:MAG: helicase, partial [Clostridiales bacterium]|nr:helicase [Clostridiales bacterium]